MEYGNVEPSASLPQGLRAAQPPGRVACAGSHGKFLSLWTGSVAEVAAVGSQQAAPRGPRVAASPGPTVAGRQGCRLGQGTAASRRAVQSWRAAAAPCRPPLSGRAALRRFSARRESLVRAWPSSVRGGLDQKGEQLRAKSEGCCCEPSASQRPVLRTSFYARHGGLVFVLTHEGASLAERAPYLGALWDPVPVTAVYGRCSKADPPCPPRTAVHFAWRDVLLPIMQDPTFLQDVLSFVAEEGWRLREQDAHRVSQQGLEAGPPDPSRCETSRCSRQAIRRWQHASLRSGAGHVRQNPLQTQRHCRLWCATGKKGCQRPRSQK